ncbi:uncharacterized protein BO96DRAFT_13126 [Aspergillus niger CBS 101883]|uniref:uncharacterized protein n=1 Tax=Aspergillus lacticoffeatus (strain CBS 101883) TaxID=1450533 RepID=UPI000D7FFB0D|nr:uncharacterized protein BO96DRAFT_13126 [Aspergillus niger CBS 101883]PYH62403.1 hypothetical protein BO96DRAFT_13126 [Aspergillus niger CBS 101883]
MSNEMTCHAQSLLLGIVLDVFPCLFPTPAPIQSSRLIPYFAEFTLVSCIQGYFMLWFSSRHR